jgi:hypothetical protein
MSRFFGSGESGESGGFAKVSLYLLPRKKLRNCTTFATFATSAVLRWVRTISYDRFRLARLTMLTTPILEMVILAVNLWPFGAV